MMFWGSWLDYSTSCHRQVMIITSRLIVMVKHLVIYVCKPALLIMISYRLLSIIHQPIQELIDHHHSLTTMNLLTAMLTHFIHQLNHHFHHDFTNKNYH